MNGLLNLIILSSKFNYSRTDLFIDYPSNFVLKPFFIIAEETDEDESSAIFNKRMAASMLSLKEELEIESKYGMDTPLAGSLLSLHPGISYIKQSKRIFINAKQFYF